MSPRCFITRVGSRIQHHSHSKPPQGCFSAECFRVFNRFYLFIYLFIYLILYSGEGREKKRERNIDVWLPLAHPLLGTWPTTQTFALTANQTYDRLVHKLALDPWSHMSQGRIFFINLISSRVF